MLDRLPATLMMACLLAAGSSVAVAQSDPASIERTVPKVDLSPTPDIREIDAPQPDRTAAKVGGNFILGAVAIEGATVFNSAELAKTFEPYIATRVGQAELDAIVTGITEQYRRAGYLLSYARLPEQAIQSGLVRLQIVEGYIETVRIEGDTTSSRALTATAGRLLDDRPLRYATLERVLGLLREVPGEMITDVRISRSPGDPARHQLTILTSGNRSQALAYTDNRGTFEGARQRLYATFGHSSGLVPGDHLQFDLFAIPSETFRYLYGQARASLPLGSDGWRLSGAFARGSQFQRLSGPDQKGKSRQVTVGLSYPFIKSRAFSLATQLNFSDWASEEKRGGVIVLRDRLQVVRGAVEFSVQSSTRWDGRFTISQGLDLGSATNKGDPLASRGDADATFTKFHLELQAARPLSEKAYAQFQASAQYATSPLLAPEEYALGGNRIGRAFDYNELTGDHGIGAGLELGYRLGDLSSHLKSLELFTFVDGGGAFRKNEGPGLPERQWLASAGGGARLSASGFRLTSEIGLPFARSHEDRDIRAFVSLARNF